MPYLQHFSLYINDLAKDLKELNIGLHYGNEKLCILLYADDIVILAENEEQLQIYVNSPRNSFTWVWILLISVSNIST